MTDPAVAAAYMTGILPIKKYGTQSAISDFREFTMIIQAVENHDYDSYLAYDEDDETVRIPDEEVKVQFIDAVRHSDHSQTARLILQSDRLPESTIRKDAKAVAEGMNAIHNSYVAPLFYNDEQALRSVVKIAYISSVNQYVRIEEMPSGKGYADLVYIPRRGSACPALVIELKADGTSAGLLGGRGCFRLTGL